jgi:hypothetical protein
MKPRVPVLGIVLSAMTVVTAGSLAAQAPASAPKAPAKAAAKSFTPARTAWGDPDLQGVYTNKDESGIPFERPSQFDGKTITEVGDQELAELIADRAQSALERAPGVGGIDTGAGPTHWYENYNAKNSRAWMVVDPPDGKIPALTPEGQARARAVGARGSSFGGGPFNGPENFSLYDRCITRGIPGSMMPAIYGNSYQIVQAPGFVAIRYEMIHETRIIPLDGRPHVSPSLKSFMGDPRGHFDGKTLVVETTNFKDLSAYRETNAATVHLVERFTPVAAGKVEWSVTVEDPTTYTKPWTFAMTLSQDASQPPFEYACHEGNYGLKDMLSAARVAEKAGSTKAAPAGNRGRAEE